METSPGTIFYRPAFCIFSLTHVQGEQKRGTDFITFPIRITSGSCQCKMHMQPAYVDTRLVFDNLPVDQQWRNFKRCSGFGNKQKITAKRNFNVCSKILAIYILAHIPCPSPVFAFLSLLSISK